MSTLSPVVLRRATRFFDDTYQLHSASSVDQYSVRTESTHNSARIDDSQDTVPVNELIQQTHRIDTTIHDTIQPKHSHTRSQRAPVAKQTRNHLAKLFVRQTIAQCESHYIKNTTPSTRPRIVEPDLITPSKTAPPTVDEYTASAQKIKSYLQEKHKLIVTPTVNWSVNPNNDTMNLRMGLLSDVKKQQVVQLAETQRILAADDSRRRSRNLLGALNAVDE